MNFTSQSMSANTAAPTQLMSADPQDWPVSSDWQAVVEPFFAGSTGQKLLQFLQQRLDAGAVIFPPAP
jgi:uracil-DNA glycosylase